MGERDEPLRVLGTQLYLLSQEESYMDESFEQASNSQLSKRLVQNTLSQVEMPFCFYAALRLLKEKKELTNLLKLNPTNMLAG